MTVHLSLRTLLQHLLFVFLLVLAPAWDYYDTQRLKRNPRPAQKVGYYRRLCSWLWIGTLAACLVAGLRPVFTFPASPPEMPWLLEQLWGRYLVLVMTGLLAAMIGMSYISVAWMRLKRQARKYASSDLMQKLSYAYLFPATRTERRWWILVGISAGVCEEVLFRGFLLRYLHTYPWRLNLSLALLLSALVFGLQHLYQGTKGIVTTAVLGVLLGLLFLLSGSLLLPILLHAAMDLRLLVILRPPER